MAEFDRYFIVFFSLRVMRCSSSTFQLGFFFFWIFMCFKSLPSVSSQRVPFENYAYREYTLSVYRSRNQHEKKTTQNRTLCCKSYILRVRLNSMAYWKPQFNEISYTFRPEWQRKIRVCDIFMLFYTFANVQSHLFMNIQIFAEWVSKRWRKRGSLWAI